MTTYSILKQISKQNTIPNYNKVQLFKNLNLEKGFKSKSNSQEQNPN